ncbi:YcgL domain-containing protein [Colwellia sp. Arc7-635]|uniref:YcgL domain-containing protein n=1 Tax=Colwellia sp. Arc7-635 TaxID=2497879 RepID=UPI000F858C1C|nr:YcgL domain-containing protein [Colwellia sp. Arc7-635]AZQ83903.1 YcgL domain-containing protein [Colwellia sp. Arc7-635]
MLCSVYKSSKKLQTYLFINKRDDFSQVPEALMKMFGTPMMVTVLNLATKDKLGFADIDKVKASLAEQGYYLQLTPKEEDMLKTHKANMNNADDNQGEKS